MTGEESLRFVEHLRQNNHLTKTAGNGELAEQGAGDRPHGQGKLWEHTDLSPSEFADEAARFYDLERVSLQDMLSATAAAEPLSERFLRDKQGVPYPSAHCRAAMAAEDPPARAQRPCPAMLVG